MSWDIFRSEYKNGHASLESSDKTKMANVIASSYDKCINLLIGNFGKVTFTLTLLFNRSYLVVSIV